MAKLAPQIPKHFAVLHFPYHEPFQDDLRQLPGAHFDKSRKAWLVPVDLLAEGLRLAQIHGVAVRAVPCTQVPSQACALSSRPLHYYQHKASAAARAAGAYLIDFETGLGKSAAAIDAVQESKAQNCLILCPPGVITVWEDELDRWAGATAIVAKTGVWAEELLQTPTTGYTIIPYSRLPESETAPIGQFAAIVLDESHSVKNPKAKRTKAVQAIRAANPDALLIETTATPIANTPKDLWTQLDLLKPGAFGSYWKFCDRYCYVEKGTYGMKIDGLREDNAAELRARLELCSMRVTKAEVAHLLPLFLVQSIKARPPAQEQRELGQLSAAFAQGSHSKHEANASAFYLASASSKIEMAVEQVKLAVEAGETHIAVMCYGHDTAARLAKAVGASYLITGAMDQAKREERMSHAKHSRRAISVITMKSMLQGIDLTWNSTAIYAELYYSPLVMIQSLGRFNRLSGRAPTKALLLVLEGTLDELVSRAVLSKIEDANRVFKAGIGEDALTKALGDSATDEEFIARLSVAANAGVFDDGGGY